MRFHFSAFVGLMALLLSISACGADEPQNMQEALNDGYRVTGFSINTGGGYPEEIFVLAKGSSLILCSYNGKNQTEEFCNRLN